MFTVSMVELIGVAIVDIGAKLTESSVTGQITVFFMLNQTCFLFQAQRFKN
jgi:hypothetical protein